MNYCKGCATHLAQNENHHDCPYYKDNQDSSCPCSNCLVKMMCGDPCDDYETWIDSVQGGTGIKEQVIDKRRR